MVFNYPVGSVSHLQSTLFLAAAMLAMYSNFIFFFTPGNGRHGEAARAQGAE
jgi:hypothetical protein